MHYNMSPFYRLSCDQCNEITMRYETDWTTRERIRGKVRRIAVKHTKETGHQVRFESVHVQRIWDDQ